MGPVFSARGLAVSLPPAHPFPSLLLSASDGSIVLRQKVGPNPEFRCGIRYFSLDVTVARTICLSGPRALDARTENGAAAKNRLVYIFLDDT